VDDPPARAAVDALDIVLIHQLLGEYGHALDAADWVRFAELFTEDAVVDYTAVRAPAVCQGIAAILAYFEAGNHPAAHHVTNIVVVARDDGAIEVHSKFLAPFTRQTHVPHRWYGGDYLDTVVRDRTGAWRFATKVCTPRWQFTAAPFDEGDIAEHRRSF
jgi:3-phenylpropionate/cinnamic acid dioxygenase small subunit